MPESKHPCTEGTTPTLKGVSTRGFWTELRDAVVGAPANARPFDSAG